MCVVNRCVYGSLNCSAFCTAGMARGAVGVVPGVPPDLRVRFWARPETYICCVSSQNLSRVRRSCFLVRRSRISFCATCKFQAPLAIQVRRTLSHLLESYLCWSPLQVFMVVTAVSCAPLIIRCAPPVTPGALLIVICVPLTKGCAPLLFSIAPLADYVRR